MKLAVAEAPATTVSVDEQLVSRLLFQRIIVLGTEVDDPVANRLCAQLLLLSAEDPRRDISLYINSPGGSVSAGLAIYDTMRLIPNDVSTLAMGLAGSMGQLLLCAGTTGKRFSLPHAQVLMHQGSAGFGGTAADVEIYAEQLERTGQDQERYRPEQDLQRPRSRRLRPGGRGHHQPRGGCRRPGQRSMIRRPACTGHRPNRAPETGHGGRGRPPTGPPRRDGRPGRARPWPARPTGQIGHH